MNKRNFLINKLKYNNFYVVVDDNNIGMLKKWYGQNCLKAGNIVGNALWINENEIKKAYNLSDTPYDIKNSNPMSGEYTFDFGNEITTEEFIKYVLKK